MLPNTCTPNGVGADLNTILPVEDAPPSVANLLASARHAHLAYRSIAKGRDYAACDRFIQSALDARISAHLLDPQEVDPAWAEDRHLMKGATPEQLMPFYVGYLSRP